MTWHTHTKRGLLLATWLALGCGPSGDGPPGETETGGEVEPTTAGSTASTGDVPTSTSDGGTSSGDASSGSSGGAPTLPCAWVEGQRDAEIPPGMTPANVRCDPTTDLATLRIAYDGLDCGGVTADDRLIIELPPEMQQAGEYDLVGLVAKVSVSADITPVSGQVDTGTLIVTAVTPTMIVGWAHGGLDGYDFSGSFEAPYCP